MGHFITGFLNNRILDAQLEAKKKRSYWGGGYSTRSFQNGNNLPLEDMQNYYFNLNQEL